MAKDNEDFLTAIGTFLMTFGQEMWHKVVGFILFLIGSKK